MAVPVHHRVTGLRVVFETRRQHHHGPELHVVPPPLAQDVAPELDVLDILGVLGWIEWGDLLIQGQVDDLRPSGIDVHPLHRTR